MHITITTELEDGDEISINMDLEENNVKTINQIFSFVESIYRAVKEADDEYSPDEIDEGVS
jgi:hypothetical protein